MALREPVPIFTASSNARAQILCHVLRQSGLEAYATEDFSLAGLWVGGTLPGVHHPQVWVERAEAERAAALLQEHERREAELRPEEPPDQGPGVVEVACEDCGQPLRFPARQRGSVQECSHCGAFVDVPRGDEFDDWRGAGEGEG